MNIRVLMFIFMALLCSSAKSESLDDRSDKAKIELDAIGRMAARDKCASPLKIVRRRVANMHDPEVVDEIQKYFCNGFDVTLYQTHASESSREFPLAVVVYRSRPELGRKLSIGAPISDVLSVLGPPARIEHGDLVYDLGESMDDSITFKVVRGKVKSIAWAWSID